MQIFIIISLMLTLCSCQRPASDLSDISEKVLKEDQGITIEFEPHPKVK